MEKGAPLLGQDQSLIKRQTSHKSRAEGPENAGLHCYRPVAAVCFCCFLFPMEPFTDGPLFYCFVCVYVCWEV